MITSFVMDQQAQLSVRAGYKPNLRDCFVKSKGIGKIHFHKSPSGRWLACIESADAKSRAHMKAICGNVHGGNLYSKLMATNHLYTH
jgi:hypothetical protein